MAASRDSKSIGTDLRQALLWDEAKRALVRQAASRIPSETAPANRQLLARTRILLGCLLNNRNTLPDIGRRVDRILRESGVVHIYFDDGSFVSAQVEDPQPKTPEEAAVIEEVYGVPVKPKACGCKKAAQTTDLIVAVRDGELLRAMGSNKRGAESPTLWRYLIDGPFELFRLSDVPLSLAMPLSDHGARPTRLRDGAHAWSVARRYADKKPFRRVVAA